MYKKKHFVNFNVLKILELMFKLYSHDSNNTYWSNHKIRRVRRGSTGNIFELRGAISVYERFPT